MKTFLAALAATVLALSGAYAQQPGPSRTNLQRHDLSMADREMIQVRVDFPPGSPAPRHSHPGEEIINVLAGTLEYQIGDEPPVTLKAGDVLFVPDGMVHRARNVGEGTASELATYIVRKGQPLVRPAP